MSFRSPLAQRHSGVLSIRPFRRLWIATSLSSLGDWLSLLALTTLAYELTGKHSATAGGLAVGGVWITSLLPYLLLGPLAGAVADRLDRRMNMFVGDVVRAVLYLSIPVNLMVGFADQLTWMYVAQFLASSASLFWVPAKDASVPNLVGPGRQLEQANQLSLLTTYGTAPVAALLFVVLAGIGRVLAQLSGYFASPAGGQVSLALYFNAATFVVSATVVYSLRELPRRMGGEPISVPSVGKAIWAGWRFAGANEAVRGITIGMVGAFAAGGVVVGLGYGYVVTTLGGGPVGWGVVFAAVFLGLALGMSAGLRLLAGFSRRRLFGVSIAFAAAPLALIALVPNLAVVAILVVLLGMAAGVAYVTGYTIIGTEVDDDTRGRTFAFLQSAIRVVMFAVIAIAPVLADGFSAMVTALSGSPVISVGAVRYEAAGYNFVLLLGAVVAMGLGMASYRHMDDRRGAPLLAVLVAALRGAPLPPVPAGAGERAGRRGRRRGGPAPGGLGGPGGPGGEYRGPGGPGRGPRGQGMLFAVEGGEGPGKSTQARLLAIWLRENGYDVLATSEPGSTKVGMRLRALLLDTAHTGLSPWAEALMYAADRAEHVSAVIEPALARGTIVVTDRYVDSSMAYQGAGRQLPYDQLRKINDVATGGLVPELTILLDLPPAEGLGRRVSSADRLEAEPEQFHERVRAGFLKLAKSDPRRYLVLDASRDQGEISREIQAAVRELLPDPVPERAEEITGSIPAIRE